MMVAWTSSQKDVGFCSTDSQTLTTPFLAVYPVTSDWRRRETTRSVTPDLDLQCDDMPDEAKAYLCTESGELITHSTYTMSKNLN
jgi:hypothetical protein